jgi:hypothetical protein
MSEKNACINIEVLNGMAHLSWWVPTDGLPTSYDIQVGNPEGTRTMLDRLGGLLGLTLTASVPAKETPQ